MFATFSGPAPSLATTRQTGTYRPLPLEVGQHAVRTDAARKRDHAGKRNGGVL